MKITNALLAIIAFCLALNLLKEISSKAIAQDQNQVLNVRIVGVDEGATINIKTKRIENGDPDLIPVIVLNGISTYYNKNVTYGGPVPIIDAGK